MKKADSLSSIVGLARVACFLAALFEAIGAIWFMGEHGSLLRNLIWPTPFIALLFGAVAPKQWLTNGVGISATWLLYIAAVAELLRRLGMFEKGNEAGSTLSHAINIVGILLLSIGLLGRLLQMRLEADTRGQRPASS